MSALPRDPESLDRFLRMVRDEGAVRIGDLAVDLGLAERPEVDVCFELQEQSDQRLGELLVDRGVINGEERDWLLAELQRTRGLQPDEEPTRRFGRYTLVRRVGEGGMGEVWRAWDRELRRWVALKLLKLDSADLLGRFRREAQTAARLNHPGIVKVYDHGTIDGRPYLAMEYIDGRPLGRAERSVREVLELLATVGDALAYAHEHGVVHRDLKPANLFRDRSGRVVLGDFGLARRVEGQSQMTTEGRLIGTPNYMAPEQVQGAEADAATDVYGLGATLYELLTGRPPFSGATAADIFHRISNEEPVRPGAIAPAVPRDVDTICLKALEKGRAERYPSVTAMIADVRAHLAGDSISASPPSPVRRAARWVRRHPRITVAAAALFLGVAVTVIGFSIQQGTRRHKAVIEARRMAEQGDLNGLMRAAGLLDQAIALRSTDELRLERLRVGREIFSVALAAGDYTLARQVADDLTRFGETAKGVAKRIADIDRARLAGLKMRAARLEAILDDIRRGLSRKERPEGSPGLEDLVFEAVKFREEQTVEVMGRMLRELPPKEWAQPERDLAIFATRVLGRIDLDSAVEPLAGWLALIRDERLAIEAAKALCDLRRAEVIEPILEATLRFNKESFFWREIEPHFAQVPDPMETQPTTGREFYRRGLMRHLRDDHAGALEDFDEAIRLDADLKLARVNRGMLLFYLKRHAEAIRDFEAVIDEISELQEAAVRSNMGAAKHYLGDHEGALKELDRALEIDPGFRTAWLNRAMILRKRGQVPEALAAFDRARMLGGPDPFLLTQRGILKSDTGDSDGAKSDFEEALRIDPDHADAWFELGLLSRRRGDLAGAEDVLSTAILKNPRFDVAYAERAMVRMHLGKRDAALDDISAAIELNGKKPVYYLRRALVHESRGRESEALQDYDRALAVDPGYADAWNNIGELHVRYRRFAEARKAFEKAIELNDRRALFWVNLSGVKHIQGDVKGALTDATRATEVEPTYARAWQVKGGILLYMKDADGAIRNCSKALQLDPRNAHALSDRATAWTQKGDHEKAMKDCNKAIALNPRWGALWFRRGMLRYMTEEFEDAVSDYDQAIKLNGRFVLAWYYRGAARFRLGQWRGAKSDIERSLKLGCREPLQLFYYGAAKMKLGEDGSGELKLFLKRFPGSSRAADARALLQEDEY